MRWTGWRAAYVNGRPLSTERIGSPPVVSQGLMASKRVWGMPHRRPDLPALPACARHPKRGSGEMDGPGSLGRNLPPYTSRCKTQPIRDEMQSPPLQRGIHTRTCLHPG